jgi:hypothetical protein
MLAESIASDVNWTLIATAVMAVATFGMWWDAKKKPLQISQPLTVEIVKALHEQFADKAEFKSHVTANTERHGQIFHRIDKVEREARLAMNERFEKLNEDRQATMEKLNNQFIFIRENLAGINRELKIRSEE